MSSTLHIITDSREPSVTCASNYMRKKFDGNEIKIYPARASSLIQPFEEMLKKFEEGDRLILTVLYARRQQVQKLFHAFAKSEKISPEAITWFPSKYEAGNTSTQTDRADIAQWCTKRNILCIDNRFETKRELGEMPDSDRLERAWVQYRLMQAIVRGQALGEEIKDILLTLRDFNLENSGVERSAGCKYPGDRNKKIGVLSKELLQTKEFFKRGEPDMAGGNYGPFESKNPTARKLNSLDDLRQRLVQIARTDMNVLISGETGTGKENVAWFIYDFSKRGKKAAGFVALNCACFSEDRLESELFGHKKGAYTGATSDKAGILKKAHNGVVFLDELHHMSEKVQAKLLRFLQEGEFFPLGETSNKATKSDVRIIGAIQPRAEHKLTEDFYQRIGMTTLKTIPLCKMKKSDIVNIARNLAERQTWEKVESTDPRGEAETITPNHVRALWDELRQPKMEKILADYDWPGNVREMGNMIKKRLLLGWSLRDQIEEAKQHRAERMSADMIQLRLSPEMRKFLEPARTMEELRGRDLQLDQLESEYLNYILKGISDLPQVGQNRLRQGAICGAFGLSTNTMKSKLLKAGFKCNERKSEIK